MSINLPTVCRPSVEWVIGSTWGSGHFIFPSKSLSSFYCSHCALISWQSNPLHTPPLDVDSLESRKLQPIPSAYPRLFTRNGFSPRRKIRLPILKGCTLGAHWEGCDLEGTSTDIWAQTTGIEWGKALFHNEGAEMESWLRLFRLR